ncbi:hypothetical protein [Kribbella catacumbae]|uniref:hypothetical protein n=1 Tax=Kribbella catacumbae TaxID=460086 RepID=UPI00037EAC2E|nr:hypothetical protein [Kribbella catacumbae]
MAFGKRSKEKGWMSGKEAEKLAKQAGRLGDDEKVRDTKGRVTGDFSKRTRKQTNEHGV